jgi:hypothetical protein
MAPHLDPTALPLFRFQGVPLGHESDTPGKAGGLMSRAASKAVARPYYPRRICMFLGTAIQVGPKTLIMSRTLASLICARIHWNRSGRYRLQFGTSLHLLVGAWLPACGGGFNPCNAQSFSSLTGRTSGLPIELVRFN